MISRKIHRTGLGLFLLWMMLFATPAWTAEITLVPLVDVSAGYDDNVYYSRVIQESDYVLTGRPGFVFDYDSALFTIRSRGSVDFQRYLDNSNLNRENYDAFIDGDVRLTERLTLRANFSFVNDTTLDSQLAETGIVTFRTDRKRYNGGGELAYQLSMRSNIGIAYNHQSTRYGSALYEDYDYDSVRASYDYAFNAGLDRFTVAPYYGRWSSDMSQVNNYGLSFGLSHKFSETLSLELVAGPRYTRTERKYYVQELLYEPETDTVGLQLKEQKASDDSWGVTGSIVVKKIWERSSISGGYSHDLTYSSSIGDDAEPINVNRFFCNLSHNITSRFGATLSASYYISESASSLGNQDRRYITVMPSLKYELTPNYSLTLTYNYQRQLNEQANSADLGLNRNTIWIGFTGQWPMKW